MKTRSAAFLTVTVVALFALFLVPATFAAKGGNAGSGGKPGGGGSSSGSSISLAPLVYDANGDGLPNYGDTVTFNISTTATEQPFVNLQCFQNGVVVLNGWNGYFDGALNTSRDFGLSSGVWQGGAADCTAWLDMYTNHGWKHLASTSFHAGA